MNTSPISYYGIYETDFQGYEKLITESATLAGAIMRGLVELWNWAERESISEVVQYAKGDTLRIVAKSGGEFWNHGIVIKAL